MTKTREASSAPSKAGLRVGQQAPDFALPSDEGRTVKLSEFRGQNVVLYFYPKDDTPGCTKESCAFRDAGAELRSRGAVVIGVSVDSVESHRKFKAKFRLNFPLLSDAEKTVVKAYGVWKEKSMYGRTYMGIERTTVLIDEQGRIATIFPKVSVDGHLEEVLINFASRNLFKSNRAAKRKDARREAWPCFATASQGSPKPWRSRLARWGGLRHV